MITIQNADSELSHWKMLFRNGCFTIFHLFIWNYLNQTLSSSHCVIIAITTNAPLSPSTSIASVRVSELLLLCLIHTCQRAAMSDKASYKSSFNFRYQSIPFQHNTNHPASHVTLWLSSGKFASGSDFKGGAFFLKGGAFFVGILPPLIFREMMQKPTPFFLPPLIIFGKKRAPLNNWKHFYCPPEFCPAFWKPPLNLNGDLKPLLVPPWFCFGIFKAPLKVEKQNKCPP